MADGKGYIGDDATLKDLFDTIYSQETLYSGTVTPPGGNPQADFADVIANSFGAYNEFLTYIANKQATVGNKFPQTTEDFIEAFVPLAQQTAANKQKFNELILLKLMPNEYAKGLITQLSSDLDIHSSTFASDLGERLFTQFLQNYQYQGAPETYVTFVTQYDAFFNPKIALSGLGETIGFGTSTVTQVNENEKVLNFQDVYNAFFVDNNTELGFRKELVAYINQLMYDNGATGTLNPLAQMGNWMKTVQENYLKSLSGSTNVTSSLGESFKKVLILDRIYQLLALMISVLQQTTVAQTERLRVLTQWQRSYTKLQEEIKTFTGAKGQDANAYNNNKNTLIQTRRSLVQDEAKSLQSAINQSNDTVNQQANLCTALIQQFSTLLGAIYR